ncbi:MAG: glycosyl hydrolase [Kiritimatiellia bacterium]
MKRALAGLLSVFAAVSAACRPAVGGTANCGPCVWWHWAGTAVTKAGIVRDLDAMRAAGIAGAVVFQVARGPCSEELAVGYADDTNPELVFGNDVWCDLVAFAAREAKARGLAIGMHNCPGYTVSGGPWIGPETAMKQLVWTSAPRGSAPAQPETRLGYYRDIGTVEVGDTVFRFGYTCTGAQSMPVAKALWNKCLEADKMSAKAVNLHLDHVLRRPLGLDFILMDSYEAGPYDWTDDFRDEFTQRRGYDPLPLLPAYVGATADGAARIRADMARTVQELSTERHYWIFRDRLHAAGMKFCVEPYGGPFDACEAAYASDLPMSEFWGATPFWAGPDEIGGDPRMGGAAGRAAGRTILAAEAYTAMPFQDPYVLSPRDFKAATDASFARGINQMFLHHWVHQPFPACRQPGMSMGYWGTHFGENATWFEPGKAFFAYLTRCQARLQQGSELIDVLAVEDFGGRTDGVDVIPRRVFKSGVVFADGKVVVAASGREYAFLAVPDALLADPEVAAALDRARAARVRLLAEHALLPKRPFSVVGGLTTGPHGPVLGTARSIVTEKTQTRLFFVANVSPRAVSFAADFRASGQPELWYPGTEETEYRTPVRTEDGYARLELELGPQESVFVTFAGGAARAQAVRQPTTRTRPLDGVWAVDFEPGRGAPATVQRFDRLVSWTESPDFGIRHFSGTATYRLHFTLTPAEAAAARKITLGEVRDIARVRLNGRELGVAWYEPFELGLQGAAREGENLLEVEVSNGWHNRLVADHNLPGDDCVWGPERFHQCALDGTKGFCGRGLERIPDWAWNADGTRPATNRITFTSWDYFTGTEPLKPSGLLGPVGLRLAAGPDRQRN